MKIDIAQIKNSTKQTEIVSKTSTIYIYLFLIYFDKYNFFVVFDMEKYANFYMMKYGE